MRFIPVTNYNHPSGSARILLDVEKISWLSMEPDSSHCYSLAVNPTMVIKVSAGDYNRVLAELRPFTRE